ncbi:MAG: hypothetical protein ACTS3F_00675 [Phycisphaerales bacterium]
MTEADLNRALAVANRIPPLTPEQRDRAAEWLLELTAIPTAAGREEGPIAWIRAWCDQRPDLTLREDRAGNLIIEFANAPSPESTRPLFITAHLDHPAFVVEELLPDDRIRLSFRGGVMDPYFVDAPVDLCPDEGQPIRATLESATPAKPLRDCIARTNPAPDGAPLAARIAPGTIARWAMPEPRIEDGVLHTHACDDLAAVVAALMTIERLRERGDAAGRHTRLLLTRGEEVGFVGAYAACRDRTMPPNARAILLENSRAFAESPIHAGVIVRVGDRLTTFTPDFTAAISRTAELLDWGRQAGPNTDPANFTPTPSAGFKWQRKLMPGGACEATCYQAFGYDAACLCLPLGNYHNMANLTGVQGKEPDAVATARCAPEHIGIDDFISMVELLEACAVAMGQSEPMMERLARIYKETSFVLGDRA